MDILQTANSLIRTGIDFICSYPFLSRESLSPSSISSENVQVQEIIDDRGEEECVSFRELYWYCVEDIKAR